MITVAGTGTAVRFSKGRNPIDISKGFSIRHFYSATYTSQDLHPRMVGDIDGDGNSY